MTRIPRLAPGLMDDGQLALYELMTSGPRGRSITEDDGTLKGPFNAFLLNPALGEALQDVGAALRYRSSLTDRVRELVTLAVAAHWDSAYEWQAHERLARAAGVTDDELAALRDRSAPDLSDPFERTSLLVVLGLLEDGDVTDDAWSSATTVLGPTVMFELTTLVGYYGTLALQLRLFRVGPSPRSVPSAPA